MCSGVTELRPGQEHFQDFGNYEKISIAAILHFLH